MDARFAPAAGFDGLVGDFGEALVCVFFEFLLDLVAIALREGERVRPAAALVEGRAAFPAAGLRDFFRVFWDIRLPFVAFRRSIIEVLRQTGIRSVAAQVGSALDYAQKDFTAPSACSLPIAFSRTNEQRDFCSISAFGLPRWRLR